MIINYLGIIPARSGSKGIKNKNILKINGKECFRYTLEPVIKSKVDKIFFSTDSTEYLRLYKKYCSHEKDITFNYLRDDSISLDKSTCDEYLNSCIDFLTQKGYIIKNFIILQPSSLFRTSEQINNVIDLHIQNNYTNIKSVSSIIQTPYYMIYQDNTKVIKNNFKNRQSHKTIYIYNGAYYVYNLHKYNSNEEVFIKYIMGKEEGYDLDDETDLKIISLLLKDKKNKN